MNYNPKSDKTLLGAIASIEQVQKLETITNKIVSDNIVDVINIELGNNLHSYILQLITNYKHLATFWKLNFSKPQKRKQPDGKIYFLDTNLVTKIFNFDKYRYYLPKKEEIVSFNNDFYGNLKISYRGLSANIALRQNLVSLHSAVIKVNNKIIAITGVSGAGKSTIFKYLLQELHGKLIWDDWGFINPISLDLIIPNEIHNHLKISSVKSLLPNFNDSSGYHTEFYEEGNVFFDNARIMLNLRKHLPYLPNNIGEKLDTLFILTNDKNQNHFIKKIDCGNAKEIFFTSRFSEAYKSKVHYFNGALFLNSSLREQHDILYLKLLKNIKNIVLINNKYINIDFKKLETHL